jgi:hypothetical protein
MEADEMKDRRKDKRSRKIGSSEKDRRPSRQTGNKDKRAGRHIEKGGRQSGRARQAEDRARQADGQTGGMFWKKNKKGVARCCQ